MCSNCNSDFYYVEDRRRLQEINDKIWDLHFHVIDAMTNNLRSVSDEISKISLHDEKFSELMNAAQSRLEFKQSYPHSFVTDLYDSIPALEEQKPGKVCWLCGSDNFIKMDEYEAQKRYSLGELKVGYHIFRIPSVGITFGHVCTPLSFMQKVPKLNDIYCFHCETCNLPMVYVSVDDSLKKLIVKNRTSVGRQNMDLDTITAEEYSAFLDDLKNSVKKISPELRELMAILDDVRQNQ